MACPISILLEGLSSDLECKICDDSKMPEWLILEHERILIVWDIVVKLEQSITATYIYLYDWRLESPYNNQHLAEQAAGKGHDTYFVAIPSLVCH